MISWMQHHKRWLIITIWIATIAFLGAGFVGWGAYSYGKKQDEVAKVKNTAITIKDVQDIYSNLFNKLNQQLGGKLDEATAKKLGLQKAAFQEALKRAILIQFAKDNGLYITDDELAKNIIEIPAFQKNGQFSKELYNRFLQNAHLTAKQFETNLKKDILIQKLFDALNLPAVKTTHLTFASLFTMEDKLSIKTIKAPKVEVSEDEIKDYWQKHKQQYKSPLSYNIGYFYIPLDGKVNENELKNYYNEHKENYTDEKGIIQPLDKVKDKVKTDLLAKKTKKEAIITMKKLKHNEIEYKKANNVTLQNKYIEPNLMSKLIQNKYLKPTLTNKGWLIATIIKVNIPKILPYEKAKNLAKQDLMKEKTLKSLEELAKNNLKNFKGKNIGFIGRDDINKLKFLSIDDADKFVSQLFNSKNPKGYVLFNDKAVLFKITAQKLLDMKKYQKIKPMIVNYDNNIKNKELNKNLIKTLLKLYNDDIKVYMKI